MSNVINLVSIVKFSLLLFLASWMFAVSAAEAATLSVSPGTGVYTVGSTFTARVLVNTQGDPINAAEATLSYNPAQLAVVGLSKGSIFSLWAVEPTYSNGAGTITFGGGSPSGYTGSNGTIVTVTFRALAAGTAKVTFKNGSVLAADGMGTNVLRTMNTGTFTVTAAEMVPEAEVVEYVAPANTPSTPKITSATHPDPSSWYTDTTARLTWTVPNDVVAVRTLLDANSGSIPTKVYDTPISEITIEDLDEGVSYFHLQFKNAEGWGRVAHYRLAVDTEAPTSFEIGLAEDADLSAPDQTLVFTIEDAASPVRRFLVQLDGAEPYEYIDETGSSTHTLLGLNPGHHSVIIEAFDGAGNSIIDTFSFAVLAFDKPQFTQYPTTLNEGVVPVFEGITRPHATVTIAVRKLGVTSSEVDAVQSYTVNSNAEGVFTFIPEGAFSTGVYELTAVATDQFGAQSEPSDAVRMAVQMPGYIAIGSFLVSVLSVVVPLIGLLALLILIVVYFVARMRKVRSFVVRETAEATKILGDEFAALEEVLAAQSDELASSRKTGKLTKAEAALIEAIEKRLAAAKKRLAKEIDDVDDILNTNHK